MCLSAQIVATVPVVWERPYFDKHVERIDRALAIEQMGEQVESVMPDKTVTRVADDEEDDLVTGDAGLLRIGTYRGVEIVTAREFRAILDEA